MPSTASMPVQFTLYDTVKRGNAQTTDVTRQVAETWEHTTRSRGGFWLATCEWRGTPEEMDALFQDGILKEIRVFDGDSVVWQGFIAGLERTIAGQTYIKEWGPVANRVKVIYSHIGTNQFSNGSAESGAWTAYNSGVTAQSTTWRTDGTYSCNITAAAIGRGATIDSAITIVANKAYQCRVTTNLVTGTWRLYAYRTDTGGELGYAEEGTAGQRVMEFIIGDDNTYAGTVGVRLVCQTASGEIYGDGGVFQESPVRAETTWYDDTLSQSEYGICEDALLEAGMTDANANALAQTELKRRAYPRGYPPATIQTGAFNNDGLFITFYGYVFTLRNKYATPGNDSASDHVSTIVTASEFVTVERIDTNALDYTIEDSAPIRGWELLDDIARSGDASGNRWNIGVYADRQLRYEQAANELSYRLRGGTLYDISGRPVDGWAALPGYCQLDDMPVGPGDDLTADVGDNPQVVYLEEITWSVERWMNGTQGITFTREAD